MTGTASRLPRADPLYRPHRRADPFPHAAARHALPAAHRGAGQDPGLVQLGRLPRAAFAVGRGARIFRHPQPGGGVRHLADDQIPHRGAGRRGLPQPRHAARRRPSSSRAGSTTPPGATTRAMCSTTARCSASPPTASACAPRSGICPGCSTAPWASRSTVEEETEAVAGLALQGPTSCAVLRDAGFAGVERLKIFDLAEFPHDGRHRSRSRAPASPAISATSCSCRHDSALSLWDRLFEAGRLHGIRAIGYTRAQPRAASRPG